jgi:hypothetical protein
MQVEGQQDTLVLLATGGRVRNTYAIYPVQVDSFWKRKLIHYIITSLHGDIMKAQAVQDEHAPY